MTPRYCSGLLLWAATLAAAPYADPRLCATCHSAIAASYSRTGMARSFHAPTAREVPAGSYDHPASATHYDMASRDGRFYQTRSQIGFNNQPTNFDEQSVNFIMGSGNHARTYLHLTPRGALLELPLAWYAENGGAYAMNPGYDTLYNPQSTRPIGYECMFCHNAYPQIPAAQDRFAAEPLYTGALPQGIDCQRCHGPAARHVELAQTASASAAAIRQAVLNPKRLPPDRQMEVCMQCHLEPTSFRLPHAIKRYTRGAFSYNPAEPLSTFQIFFDEAPGAPRSERVEIASSVYRFRKSACFLQSKGAFQCTTCHNPHDIPHGPEAAAHYNSVCRQCHSAARLVADQQHPTGSDCVSCHMPKRRSEDVVHVVVTDHYIQRAAPIDTAPRPERVETDANAYHGPVIPYYPGPAADQLYVAIAQIRDKSNLTAGIPSLSRMLRTTSPVRAEPWFELAEALRASKQWDRAVVQYRQALQRDSAYLPALLALGTTLREARQLDQSAAAFERATRAFPAEPAAWNQLGQIELDRNHPAQALAALEKSVAFDPLRPEAYNGLGIVFAQLGEIRRAEAAFRESIRILPDSGEVHGNLANLLSAKRDFAEAAFEFDQALRFQPDDANTHFNYGAMLNGLRLFDQARVQMQAAVAGNPRLAQAHDILGNLFERAGQMDEALREYRAAVNLKSDLASAQLDLGATLSKNGDRAGALEHLKRAAQSQDPAIQRMANALIDELRR